MQQPGRLALRQGLPSAAAVTIDVYGVRGARVRGLLRSEQVAGEHFVPLDAKRITTGTRIRQRRLIFAPARGSRPRRPRQPHAEIHTAPAVDPAVGLDADAPARQARRTWGRCPGSAPSFPPVNSRWERWKGVWRTLDTPNRLLSRDAPGYPRFLARAREPGDGSRSGSAPASVVCAARAGSVEEREERSRREWVHLSVVSWPLISRPCSPSWR